ncbi:MAG: class I SAM-dependent RNA methyltransferase [Lentisphaerae bacterium]|nr:class I SAM-dependent RNA methyltransferase [Lentisphaerota bacterium]
MVKKRTKKTKKPPVEKAPDPIVELLIEDVGYRGRGVGRFEGRVVFVPGTIEGERVRVRIRHEHKSFSDGQLLEVLDPSPARVTPACPLALQPVELEGAPSFPCVGCAYQHMDYTAEVALKQAQLVALLKRIGHLENLPFLDPVAAPSPQAYRNKITLHGGRFQGQPVLGYVGANNVSVLDVPACGLAHEAINTRLAELRAEEGWLAALRRSSTVQLRYTEADGVGESIRNVKRYTDLLTEASPLGDVRVPAGSFYQVNPAVADLLLAQVQGLIEASSCTSVLDLYCGVGLFSLAAGLAGKTVQGIDCDDNVINAARQNAADRSLDAVSFEVAQAEEVIGAVLDQVAKKDTLLILDPPRTGLDKRVTDALVASPPRELIYVSCAPDTLARDLERLGKAGYRITQIQLFDMFPRTACFETVVHAVAG